MKVTLNNDEAVPIIISHRLVTKPPQISITRNFIGIRKGLMRLALKTLEFIEQTFWEEVRDTLDPGESKVVHYAIDIEDDGMESEVSNVVATKLHGNDRPGCGLHLEVVKVIKQDNTSKDGVIRISDGEDYDKPKFEGKRNIQRNSAPNLPLSGRRSSIRFPEDTLPTGGET